MTSSSLPAAVGSAVIANSPVIHRRQSTPGASSLTSAASSKHRRAANLNVGFAVDFDAHHPHRNPLKRVDELRQHLLDEAPELHRIDPDGAGGEEGAEAGAGAGRPGAGRPPLVKSDSGFSSDTEAYAQYDTFDDCLHAAHQMDSLLSFYYEEEGRPDTIKVCEIFPLKEEEEEGEEGEGGVADRCAYRPPADGPAAGGGGGLTRAQTVATALSSAGL